MMSIRVHLILLVLFCALGGAVLGIFLIDRQHEANQIGNTLAKARQQQHDVQRLEDQIKTLLISTDLLFGSGETYMLGASRVGARSALELTQSLSDRLRVEQTSLKTKLHEIEKNLQDLVEEVDQLELSSNQSVFEVNNNQLDRVDNHTFALVAALQLINESVRSSLAEYELHYDNNNSQFDISAWGAVSAYLASLLASLVFAARSVSNPLAKLSSSASEALADGAKFSLQPEGPTEVQSLGSNISQLIDSLEANNARNNALIEAIPDTLFVVHRHHGINHVKPAIDVNSGKLISSPDWKEVRALLGEEQLAQTNAMIKDCLNTRLQQQIQLAAEHGSKIIHLEARATFLNDDEVVLVVRDLTEKYATEERIRHMAYHDSLTGLLNRRALKDDLATHFEKQENEPMAMFYIDVDRFKTINDTHGHEAGDSVLQHITSCLEDCLRPGDTVGLRNRQITAKSARIGGDEFVLLLPGIADEAEAEIVADRLHNAVATPFTSGGIQISVSASIGISLYPEHGTSVETLMHNADLAMFKSKRAGGQRTSVYSANLGDESHRKISLEAKLKIAIEKKNLFLMYQPKIDLSSRMIVGAEALVRWRDEDTIIPPNEFIPIAEETGLILPLGEFVAETATEQMAVWRQRGLRLGTMAINVSAAQLKQEHYSQSMLTMVADHGLPPSALNLEITESLLLDNYEQTVTVLRELQKGGFSIAMDDFGTGYSSLSYLKELPIDVLKIDRAFVSGITESATERAIIATILQLGKTLGLRIVAEGIETVEHARFLTNNGCDEAQGYLFSPPVTAEEFEALVETMNVSGNVKKAI